MGKGTFMLYLKENYFFAKQNATTGILMRYKPKHRATNPL